ncbi:hypothetical protein GF377_04740, partial [candidate division GN15 bacterium]|nr:hypothetical protein [candidate division GN15 bacterium]
MRSITLPIPKRYKSKPPVTEELPPVPSKVEWLRPNHELFAGRHIGLSIDDGSVQLAAARHMGPRVVLADVKRVPLTDLAEDEPARQLRIRTAIHDFIHRHGGHKSHISVTVSGRETALRTLLLPNLSRSKLNAAVTFEARRQLPFPNEECRFDHRPVQRIVAGSNKRLKI